MEKVIDKVRDLLRLAASDNVNEAAAAMAAAQRLMERHRIDQAMLDVSSPDDETSREPIEHGQLAEMGGGALPRWKWRIAAALCDANACKGYTTTRLVDWQYRKSIHVIGRTSDAQTVRYLFAYVVGEIDRLTDRASQDNGRPGRTWCHSFRLGASMAVSARIREATTRVREEARAAAPTAEALAKVDGALAKLDRHRDALDEYGARVLKLRSSRAKHSWPLIDGEALAAGRAAGEGISLSPGRPLPPGVRGELDD